VEAIALQPVDALSVTMLMDNVTDLLLDDQGPAKRPSTTAAPRMPARFLAGGETDDALRAEHGFSALVTIMKGGRETRVLFDAGRTPDGVVENMRRLELSARDIDIVVLSHGHWDHTTGMDGLVNEIGRPNMPVLIHPEFWTRRRVAFPGRDPVELPTTSKRALQGAGFEIVEQRQPSFLLDGSLLVTGEVDRTTEFERGFPGHEAHRHGAWQPDPLILDDQALVATVRGHGLVVLTGCGHSGIVNILRYVRQLTGESRLHAVLGGFHLSGRPFEPSIGPTCDALAELAPDFLVPAHCTGFGATHAIAARFPEAFIQNSVGTRYEFAATEASA
jgi:7,8-dihydropterin-6-yl-methyl-4-(beta-D-ribofuranosyl)aminobenzene 5'-phosphate synthase